MKIEQLLAKCPECGSQDKTAKRRMLDEHRAHAELDVIVCDKCGYVFEENKKEKE
ncbi:TIGR04165 family Cys-rich peptide [Methanobrevibacter filiformis]|nr:TIGR04165 family Cys-rich peptide [Methanobrevibacter filiformis]